MTSQSHHHPAIRYFIYLFFSEILDSRHPRFFFFIYHNDIAFQHLYLSSLSVSVAFTSELIFFCVGGQREDCEGGAGDKRDAKRSRV
jgi:hypothetical protein